MAVIDEKDTFYPESPKHWRKWLEKNHLQRDFIWLIFYKKNSGMPSLTWSESVDQALCFGWIDSVKKTLDEKRYIQYFCKRKNKSNWSEINKQKVAFLTKNGLMREAGLICVEVAKQNGMWDQQESVDDETIPEDLMMLLQAKEGSVEFFKDLSPSVRKNILRWIAAAKREETRKKRISAISDLMEIRKKPKFL